MKRVAAPERTRERLRALMDGRLGTAPARSNLVLLAAQLIVEEALEAEVRDEVGRERYERADGEVAHPVCETALSRRAREALLDRSDDARSAVRDHKQRIAEPPATHVLEEGPNRLGVLL